MTKEEIIELADKLERISSDMHWQLLHDSAEAIRELVRQRDELLAALERLAEVYDAMGAPRGPSRIIADSTINSVKGQP